MPSSWRRTFFAGMRASKTMGPAIVSRGEAGILLARRLVARFGLEVGDGGC